MLLGFAGFTATKGSTSLLTKFVPGPPTVQLANGLRPETSIGPAAASAIPATAIAATAVTPAMIQRKRRMPPPPQSGYAATYITLVDTLQRPRRGGGEWVAAAARLTGQPRARRRASLLP